MSQQVSLEVETRKGAGKGFNRRLRAQGLVPGIYYDGGGRNIAVQVPRVPLEKVYARVKTSMVFDLEIVDGGATEKKPVLIKDVHHHHLKSRIDHIDFYGVDLAHELRIQVPVEVVGSPRGLVDGGVLDLYRESIEVSCLPAAIPKSIVIDVSGLGINQNVNIKDIPMPEGVRAVYDESFAVVGVSAPAGAEQEKGAAADAETDEGGEE
jgi:large subunit ribosomal protein L25